MPEVTTYYLEMSSEDKLEKKAKPEDFSVGEAQIKQYQMNRFLYQLVGENWQWTDKLELSNEQWRDYAERDNLRTWVAHSKGSVAGYYELEKRDNGDIEIAYFGLSPKFIGKGFGSFFLYHAIQSAWNWGDEVKRVTVNTCSLDHPSALQNYQARGFEVYREVVE